MQTQHILLTLKKKHPVNTVFLPFICHFDWKHNVLIKSGSFMKRTWPVLLISDIFRNKRLFPPIFFTKTQIFRPSFFGHVTGTLKKIIDTRCCYLMLFPPLQGTLWLPQGDCRHHWAWCGHTTWVYRDEVHAETWCCHNFLKFWNIGIKIGIKIGILIPILKLKRK